MGIRSQAPARKWHDKWHRFNMESGIQIFLMFSLSRRRERNIYLIKPQYNKHGISEKGLIIYF